VVRLRMEDGEAGEHERRCEEEQSPRSTRELPDRALPGSQAGLFVAHFRFLSRDLLLGGSASSKTYRTRCSSMRASSERRRLEEQHRRPVPGGHVGDSLLEPVVGGDEDVLEGHTRVGLGRFG
jgi:hypothetical protein